MRRGTAHPAGGTERLGLDVGAAGVAFGLVVLVVFAFTRGRAAHRPARRRTSALDPTSVYSPGGLLDLPGEARGPGHPARESSGTWRSPGTRGSAGGPAPVRMPGPPATPGAREAAPPPRTSGVPGGGRSHDRPSPSRAGAPPPRPAGQTGMNPGGPGRVPHGQGDGQVPPGPPRNRMRFHEAPRPGQPMPPREPMSPGSGVPPREAMPLREAMPPREATPPRGPAPPRGPGWPREAPRPGQSMPARDGIPSRAGMPHAGPMRPGGPTPPREPVNPLRPGPSAQGAGSGPGCRSGGPGHDAPGGPPRHGTAGPSRAPGPSGAPEPPGFSGQFDGGYAYVIRAADNPVRPASHVRAGDPAHPATPAYPASPGPEGQDAEVYVYRDTSESSGHPAVAATEPAADEPDASYWYDLSGEDNVPVPAETRGPFEPLVSSSRPPSDPGPPATAPPPSSAQDPAGPRAMAPG